MFKRGLVDDETIELADDTAVAIIAKAINAPQDMVPFQVAGK